MLVSLCYGGGYFSFTSASIGFASAPARKENNASLSLDKGRAFRLDPCAPGFIVKWSAVSPYEVLFTSIIDEAEVSRKTDRLCTQCLHL